MNINLVEQDVQKRIEKIENLEGSLLHLNLDAAKHLEAISLISYEVFFLRDQLFNYSMLLNILRDGTDDKMPETF